MKEILMKKVFALAALAAVTAVAVALPASAQ